MHTSSIVRVPNKKFTVICLSNTNGYVYPWNKTFEVIDLFFPPPVSEKVPLKSLEMIQLPLEELQVRAGIYYRITEKGTGQIRKVGIQKGKLAVSPSLDFNGLAFEAIDNNQFIAINSSGKPINISFDFSENGDSSLIEKYETYKHDWKFNRISFKPSNLSEYTGVYRDPQHGVYVKIKSKKSVLIAQKGLLKVRLIPFEKDLFSEPDGELVLQFNRNPSGKVNGLELNLDNIRKLKMRKG